MLLTIPANGERFRYSSLILQVNSNSMAPGTKLWWYILHLLQGFSQNMFNNMMNSDQSGGNSQAAPIGSSCITCLAHLAVLCEVVGPMHPNLMEMGNPCDWALQRSGQSTANLNLLLRVRQFSSCS